MRKIGLLIGLALLAQVFTAGIAGAAYVPENDITISISTGQNANLPLNEQTANEMFEAQEAIHTTITETSGQEIDHSYIWIEVDGKKILAVDPPNPAF
jgi:type IV secretory pathway VirB10-like protein